MSLLFRDKNEFIEISLNDIPILSSEKDFVEKFNTPTLQHSALRLDMLEKIIPYIKNCKNFSEFGVYKGDTAKKILSLLPDLETYLFDSFEGLPEDWDDWFKKGHFALDENQIPDFRTYNNINIYKGYFDKTTIDFALYLEKENKKLDFIHIDCDLYSSTKTIFENLNSFIVKDTIIHFDELVGIGTWYKDWKNGEYKALLEWSEKYNRSFEYLCRTDYT